MESITNNYNNLSTLQAAVFPSGTTIVTWTATDASGNFDLSKYSKGIYFIQILKESKLLRGKIMLE
ncbi:MAG: HYR domain-containing protein [Bacteroidales bacterium]|nr:HYR domain-containing protein [Bacteroidales bacterium]MCF8399559.1 HYR domain-containing protein [Bacteroidales bacterium]